MFGVDLTEMLLIAVVALLVVGPERLPAAARTLGRTFRQLRNAASEAKNALEAEMALMDLKAEKKAAAAKPPVEEPPSEKADNAAE